MIRAEQQFNGTGDVKIPPDGAAPKFFMVLNLHTHCNFFVDVKMWSQKPGGEN